MTRLVNAVRPAEQRADYRFVKNSDTGRTYKAMVHFEETPGHDPVVKVSVAETDSDGHAVKWANEDPVVFWHSHTFTAVELEAEDFDVEQRVSAMLHTAIEAEEKRRLARTKVSSLAEKWQGKKGLDLSPPPPPVPPEAVSDMRFNKGE